MAIHLDHVTKRYHQQAVVSDVNLEVRDGECFVLVGPSGSGKSTILRMIAGLTDLDEGRIVLTGRDVTSLPPQQRNTGFVFQHYALFQHLTIGENIEFPLSIRKVPTAQRRKRRDELLELVGLAGLTGRYPRQLSGGQQQRVALARALAHQPDVLLLDEPFGALDARIRSDLRRRVRAILNELNLTAIFVTHDQEEAFELGDRIGVMAGGRLLEVGTPSELYQRPQTEFVASFLGTANVLIGICSEQHLQIGPIRFPLHTASEASNRVQVVFRPEDVVLSAESSDLICPLLGAGVVTSITFAGAFERLRLQLPEINGLRTLAPPQPFGSAGILIEVLRTPEETRRLPLRVGDTAWVGIRSVHALTHPGLSMAIIHHPEASALEFGSTVARLSHARTTVLAWGLDDVERQRVREQAGHGIAALSIHPAHGSLETALRAAIERAPVDLIVFCAKPRELVGLVEQALNAGQHHVLVFQDGVRSISNALVAVTDGEPGKEDILFAARFLRHLGAQAKLTTVLWPEDHDPKTRQRLEEFLAAGVRTMNSLDVNATAAVENGEVLPVLTQALASGDYDLLVVGAPLPNRDGRIALTGIVERLLAQTAKQALLIVRSTVEHPARRVRAPLLIEESR